MIFESKGRSKSVESVSEEKKMKESKENQRRVWMMR